MQSDIKYKNKIVSIPRIILVASISIYLVYYILSLPEWHFIDNVNLIFHEAGHIVFGFFGSLTAAFGGTLMQILIPIIFCFYFYKNNEKFSASLLLFWLSQNLFNVYVYVNDAIDMELPLLGGDGVYHDWNYILSSVNLLNYTDKIASMFYIMGIIVLLFAVVFSVKFSINQD